MILKLSLMTFIVGAFGAVAHSEDLFHDLPLVMMYHDVVERDADIKITADVTFEQFKAQLTELKNRGYQTVSLDEFYESRLSGKALPARSFMLTLDDGYLGDYERAAPFLREMQFKATFFINVALVGTTNEKGPRMNWDQIIELSKDPLFSIQSHGMDHLKLTVLSDSDALHEIKDSKLELQNKLNTPVNYFAYPFGYFDPRIIDITKKYYHLAFAVSPVQRVAPGMQVRRFGAQSTMKTLDQFNEALELWLAPLGQSSDLINSILWEKSFLPSTGSH